MINIPPGQPVFSMDVECVATGVQHNARSVAQVALVDEWSRPVFNAYIKQDAPVSSYIYELTGLTEQILNQYGLPLGTVTYGMVCMNALAFPSHAWNIHACLYCVAEAMAHLRAHLSPSAVLVGQSIQKDVQWLQLCEGVDYHSLVDLSGLFRVWNPSRDDFTNFSQDHCARVWIGIGDRSQHNAVTDAAISMSLFNAYRTLQWDPDRLEQMQKRTLSAPRVPGFSALYPTIDGCW